MKATEGRVGRVFVLRLEDGDEIPGCIERFAEEKGIINAQVQLLGGIDKGDIVVGPRKTDEMPPQKMVLPIDGAHEIAALGVIAPDENNKPILHLHGALGRAGQTTTGCLREGVKVWLVCEAVINEILGVNATRVLDEKSGFKLLNVQETN
jgi:uncharacterized protein